MRVVPLSQKLIAVVVAFAVAGGSYVFLSYRQAQAASASLSFDSSATQELNSGVANASQPAVVLAQSILSDALVARLVLQAGTAQSPTAVAMGEFRARVSLTQPTAARLSVGYRDPDATRSAAIANAVAEALAAWTPSAATTPPGTNDDSALAPVTKTALEPPSASQQNAAESSLPAELEDLQAQLSAAARRVETESSLASVHDRQRYLESQVRAVQQKLDDLRSQSTQSEANSGNLAPLNVVAHALAHFWPSSGGLDMAGTSEAEFAYEHEQLTRDIGVIEQQRRVAQHADAAASASASPPPRPNVPSGMQLQTGPTADMPSSPTSGIVKNPFHLQRPAGSPMPVVWWPAPLAGCLLGLLYWGIAARFYSSPDAGDLLGLREDRDASIDRLLDSDPRVPRDSRQEWIETYRAKSSAWKRASFLIEDDPGSDQASEQPSTPVSKRPELTPEKDSEPVSNQSESSASALAQAIKLESVIDAPTENAVAPSDTNDTCPAETASSYAEAAPQCAAKAQEGTIEEKAVEREDSWGDAIRKSLLDTRMARLLDPQSAAEDLPTKGPNSEIRPAASSDSDRLVG